MNEVKHNPIDDARKLRELILALLTEIRTELKFLDDLDDLEAEALGAAEQYGPIRGPILRRQRAWSDALDQIQAARQASVDLRRAA